jgi:hypothetical protein
MRCPEVAEHANVHEVGICRVDDDVGDLPSVAESDECPRLSAVGRLPHAIAVRNVSADRKLAAADVDDVRRRRCDFDGTDRPAEILVGDRAPMTGRR